MSSIEERRPWDRQPNETDSSWAAFTLFLQMPFLHPDRSERRTLKNLQRKLGHSAARTTVDWSRKYQWMARARAHDMALGIKVEEVRLGALEEMQNAVLQTSSNQVAKLNKIIDGYLDSLQERLSAGDDIKSTELKAATEALKLKDDVMRRIANMPTEFKYQRVDDIGDDEDVVYVLGGIQDG